MLLCSFLPWMCYTLSQCSMQFINSDPNNAGGTTQAVYTLTYRSSSNGQQLTITFVEVNAYYSVANVALEAATLQ
jgi:hypothetical protein